MNVISQEVHKMAEVSRKRIFHLNWKRSALQKYSKIIDTSLVLLVSQVVGSTHLMSTSFVVLWARFLWASAFPWISIPHFPCDISHSIVLHRRIVPCFMHAQIIRPIELKFLHRRDQGVSQFFCYKSTYLSNIDDLEQAFTSFLNRHFTCQFVRKTTGRMQLC